MNELSIPVFDGMGLNIFWEENSKMRFRVCNKTLQFYGNTEGYVSIVKQLLYFFYNHLFSHVHYGNSILTPNWVGKELIIVTEDAKSKQLESFPYEQNALRIHLADLIVRNDLYLLHLKKANFFVYDSEVETQLHMNLSACYVTACELLRMIFLPTHPFPSDLTDCLPCYCSLAFQTNTGGSFHEPL